MKSAVHCPLQKTTNYENIRTTIRSHHNLQLFNYSQNAFMSWVRRWEIIFGTGSARFVSWSGKLVGCVHKLTL